MQILVNGLLLGGLYGLMTVGFSLVWGVMNVVNIAHAGFIMLGAYISFLLFGRWGIDPFAALPVAMAVLFVIGYLVQRLIINRVVKHGLVMTLIITFGVDMMLTNLALLAFSADYRMVRPAYHGAGLAIAGVTVPAVRVAIAVFGLILMGLLALFLGRTRTGMAIRATALHQEAAELVGVTIDQVYATTFGVAAAIAGAAGVMISTLYSFNPEIGKGFLTRSFVITVLGGLGSIPGAVLGGVLLGLVEAVGTVVVGPGFTEATSFAVLVAILALRPQGLLGKRFYGGAKA